jgi:hypothetical protein
MCDEVCAWHHACWSEIDICRLNVLCAKRTRHLSTVNLWKAGAGYTCSYARVVDAQLHG